MPQQPDYDALAKAHGGVDYDAIAARVSAPSASAPPKASSSVDWVDRLVQWLPEVGGFTGGTVGAVGGPAGAIMGAALGGGAGEAYKELINRARGHVAAPASSLEAAQAVAKSGAVQGAAQAVGEAVVPAAKFMGQRLMQSAVKPGVKTLTQATKAGESTPRVVQTLLDEGINVTPAGVGKLQALLASTNDDIAKAIAPSTAKIEPLSVASRLTDTAKRFATQVNPQPDLEAISRVGENFLDAQAKPITVQAAQALKQGTYARIGEKYGREVAASIEAEKALARGLKEEIAANVPGVSALNAREGRLLEALDTVGRRVALAGNRDPIGFAWVAHNPTTFLAALIDRSPAVKSLLARGMYQGAALAGKVTPQAIRVATHALLTGDPEAALSTSSGPADR